jgi:hypothetical protein
VIDFRSAKERYLMPLNLYLLKLTLAMIHLQGDSSAVQELTLFERSSFKRIARSRKPHLVRQLLGGVFLSHDYADDVVTQALEAIVTTPIPLDEVLTKAADTIG